MIIRKNCSDCGKKVEINVLVGSDEDTNIGDIYCTECQEFYEKKAAERKAIVYPCVEECKSTDYPDCTLVCNKFKQWKDYINS